METLINLNNLSEFKDLMDALVDDKVDDKLILATENNNGLMPASLFYFTASDNEIDNIFK